MFQNPIHQVGASTRDNEQESAQPSLAHSSLRELDQIGCELIQVTQRVRTLDEPLRPIICDEFQTPITLLRVPDSEEISIAFKARAHNADWFRIGSAFQYLVREYISRDSDGIQRLRVERISADNGRVPSQIRIALEEKDEPLASWLVTLPDLTITTESRLHMIECKL